MGSLPVTLPTKLVPPGEKDPRGSCCFPFGTDVKRGLGPGRPPSGAQQGLFLVV